MSGYLAGLVERHLAAEPEVRPRARSVFEPAPAPDIFGSAPEIPPGTDAGAADGLQVAEETVPAGPRRPPRRRLPPAAAPGPPPARAPAFDEPGGPVPPAPEFEAAGGWASRAPRPVSPPAPFVEDDREREDRESYAPPFSAPRPDRPAMRGAAADPPGAASAEDGARFVVQPVPGGAPSGPRPVVPAHPAVAEALRPAEEAAPRPWSTARQADAPRVEPAAARPAATAPRPEAARDERSVFVVRPVVRAAPEPPHAATREEPASAPVVEVHIGRIEVRAAPVRETPAAVRREGPVMSLDDYLRRRERGGR